LPHRLTTYDDLAIGRRASVTRVFTQADVETFRDLTGDTNPLHDDPDFAGRTFFGGTIVHGLLSGALFSTLVGTLLPGTGAIYRSQSLEFLAPVRAGDRLTATAVVRSLDRAADRIELDTWIENQDGRRVLEGRAVVSLIRGFRSPGGSPGGEAGPPAPAAAGT
jgi:acyl dehydratase